MGLGLTRLDSQVYIYLAKKGPQKGQVVSKGLKVQKQQLYRSLKNLQKKGIVTSTLEHPARFSAVSFDKVVDVFVKAKMAEAHQIQENKDEILANWQSITLADSLDSTAKFNVIEGRGPVYAKVVQMLKEAKTSIAIISTVAGLVRADQFGVFNDGLATQIPHKILFRAITELTQQNKDLVKNLLKDFNNAKFRFEGRTSDLNFKLPQMILRDGEEIIFFIAPNLNVSENEDVCLWTNCMSLVHGFMGIFEENWQNSTAIEEKILELESGKPATPKTVIIKDPQLAQKKWETILNEAEQEIVFITSAQAITKLSQNYYYLIDMWTKKGLSVKIMAPITNREYNFCNTSS